MEVSFKFIYYFTVENLMCNISKITKNGMINKIGRMNIIFVADDKNIRMLEKNDEILSENKLPTSRPNDIPIALPNITNRIIDFFIIYTSSIV